mmetsp:Transcript_98685/g.294694  ORF Transcript_98685/g.294694 Transcript_98685/m.294694 type:complete len:253 (-) Transcript_98685:140-898(-)
MRGASSLGRSSSASWRPSARPVLASRGVCSPPCCWARRSGWAASRRRAGPWPRPPWASSGLRVRRRTPCSWGCAWCSGRAIGPRWTWSSARGAGRPGPRPGRCEMAPWGHVLPSLPHCPEVTRPCFARSLQTRRPMRRASRGPVRPRVWRFCAMPWWRPGRPASARSSASAACAGGRRPQSGAPRRSNGLLWPALHEAAAEADWNSIAGGRVPRRRLCSGLLPPADAESSALGTGRGCRGAPWIDPTPAFGT